MPHISQRSQPPAGDPNTVRVRLICEGLPANQFEGFDGRQRILVTLQTKDGFVTGTPHGDEALAWTTEITAKPGADGTPDFAGPAVHGKRGERFFYLSWSGERAGRREMFRRLKLHLRDLTPAQIDRARKFGGILEGRVHAVAKDGGPACASVPLLGGWKLSE
jgi:fermentation-respiration switch protein FrsA (DUF1100 family)